MEKVNVLLEKLIQYLEATEKFVATQSPAIIQQFLEYEAWFAGTFVIAGAIAILLGAFVFLYLNRTRIKTSRNSTEEICGGFMAVSAIVCFVGFVVMSTNYVSYKKVELAPKVIALDYLKEKLK